MEQLHFTTYVLGKKGAARLEQYQVTQTLRAEHSGIVQAVLSGRLKVGDTMHDTMQVILDDRMIGLAKHISMDRVSWNDLTIDDAHRGGFDTRFELLYALKRAGYRFQPIDKYKFFRCRFSWVDTYIVEGE